MSDTIKEKVLAASSQGKLSCKSALKLADELDVSPSKVGAAADEQSIKIVSCQLGCFG